MLALADHLPAEAAEAVLDLATGTAPCAAGAADARSDAMPSAEMPVEAPGVAAPPPPTPSTTRRAAPLPRGDGRRRAGPRPRVPVGALDGLPPPRAARAGRAALRRAGARRRLGRHGEDRRRAPPRRPPGAGPPGGAHPPDHLLGDAGERAPHQARAADRDRAASPRAHRRGHARHGGPPAPRAPARPADGRLTRGRSAISWRRRLAGASTRSARCRSWSRSGPRSWMPGSSPRGRRTGTCPASGGGRACPRSSGRPSGTTFARVRAALHERGLMTQADLYSRVAARLAAECGVTL